jgi:hypothetical protein
MSHVANGKQMDQSADARDHQSEKGIQCVHAQRERNVQRTHLNPLKQSRFDDAGFFWHRYELYEEEERKDKRTSNRCCR